MTSTLVVLSVLAAAPFKVAAGNFSVSGLPAERQDLYVEHVGQQLTVAGIKTVTPRQVSALLGMERQKALLGCGDESGSCMAELAAALGADGILQGEVAKLDQGFQVSLKVLWNQDGRPLTIFTGRAASEGELLDLMTTGAKLMAVDLIGDWPKLTATPANHLVTPASPLFPTGFVLLGVAAAGAAAGTVGVARAQALAWELNHPDTTYVSEAAARRVADDGKAMQALMVTGFAVAGAALATGIVFTILGRPDSEATVTPVAAFGPDGASVGFAGVLP